MEKGLIMYPCFVIMPINNPETEPLWGQVYDRVITEAGFKPVRVDKNDNGRWIPEQIINGISYSPLIVADLTFARPNCYFEVGYAMGRGKFENLILCCREDHYDRSPQYDSTGHTVHFDLQSFGVIWWHENRLTEFSDALSEKITQRKNLIKQPVIIPSDGGSTPSFSSVMGDLANKQLDQLISNAQKGLKIWKRMS